MKSNSNSNNINKRMYKKDEWHTKKDHHTGTHDMQPVVTLPQKRFPCPAPGIAARWHRIISHATLLATAKFNPVLARTRTIGLLKNMYYWMFFGCSGVRVNQASLVGQKSLFPSFWIFWDLNMACLKSSFCTLNALQIFR